MNTKGINVETEKKIKVIQRNTKHLLSCIDKLDRKQRKSAKSQNEKALTDKHIKEMVCTIKHEIAEHLCDKAADVDLSNLKSDFVKIKEKLKKRADHIDPKPHGELIAKSKLDRKPNLNPETIALNKFISETGGPGNGWSLDDHQLFLKIHFNSKSRKLVSKLHALMPDKTVEDIENHEMWYREYMKLKSKQEDAIRKWREKKYEETRIAKEEKKKQQELLERNLLQGRKIIRNGNTKQKIVDWKKNKEIRKKEMQDDIRAKCLQLEEVERKKLAKRVEIRNVVEARKNMLQEIKSVESLQRQMQQVAENRKKKCVANKLILEFQKKDVELVALKRTQALMRCHSAEILPPTKIEAPRDPSRLLRPTVQWQCRIRSADIERSRRCGVQSINNVPKLAVPEWRKGLH